MEQPREELLQKLADFYTVFSDCTRVKVLYQLMDGEKCVGDIADGVGIRWTWLPADGRGRAFFTA